MFQKVRFLFLILAAFSLASSVGAQELVQKDSMNPFRVANVHGDNQIVRFFYSVTCPHSRLAHQTIQRWGGTLPKSLRFIQTPIVTAERSSMVSAGAFHTAKLLRPSGVDHFLTTVYSLIQDKHYAPESINTYLEAAKANNYDVVKFERVMRSDRVIELFLEDAKLLSAYRLETTPSIAIGGKYLVDPEPTQGINANFFELINAVTSKYLIEAEVPK